VGPMLPPLRRPSRQQVPLLLLLLLLDLAWGLRFPAQAPWAGPRSMRGRHGRAAVRLAEEDGGQSPLANFFKTNRDTPEAKANQMKWAREQMALEVPDETLEGSKIADREDLIAQYIESERAKFGREIERATAEAEVDAWLLKQATFAPAQTSTADLAIAATVFLATFGVGLFVANQGS